MSASLHKVMYVEDDTDIQQVAELALRMVGGFEVLLCSSGKEALEHYQTFAPDILLLDVMMPDMDGPSTLAALQQRGWLGATPVAFITAKVQPVEVAHFMSLGATDVIQKPFDPMRLADQVQAVWAKRVKS